MGRSMILILSRTILVATITQEEHTPNYIARMSEILKQSSCTKIISFSAPKILYENLLSLFLTFCCISTRLFIFVISISRDKIPIMMSTLHRPHLESERKRIVEAGGFIQRNRVNSMCFLKESEDFQV
jgi:hypothetical protein